ncbi:unnamed protein product [Paramecium sonneborni]|uniref:Uncharacterized protein n=1 Tax=Paramecium sonneborni TaxID=65129 RepID=A0A8S1RPM8_9CILI|nr:unnamed protein product [Paramecium sonneborni]
MMLVKKIKLQVITIKQSNLIINLHLPIIIEVNYLNQYQAILYIGIGEKDKAQNYYLQGLTASPYRRLSYLKNKIKKQLKINKNFLNFQLKQDNKSKIIFSKNKNYKTYKSLYLKSYQTPIKQYLDSKRIYGFLSDQSILITQSQPLAETEQNSPIISHQLINYQIKENFRLKICAKKFKFLIQEKLNKHTVFQVASCNQMKFGEFVF